MQALGKKQKVTWEEHLTNWKAKLPVATENPVTALLGTSCVAKTSISLQIPTFFLKLFLFSHQFPAFPCLLLQTSRLRTLISRSLTKRNNLLSKSINTFGETAAKKAYRNITSEEKWVTASQHPFGTIPAPAFFQKLGRVNRKFLHSDSQLCLSKHLPPSTGGCTSSFHLLLQGRVMPALEDSRDQKHCNCTVYKLRGWWEPLILLSALNVLMTAEV